MITIYSKDYCPYCTAAKQFLDGQKIEYQEVNLDGDQEKLMEVVSVSGMMTVPQIFDGEVTKENFIWGYDDMIAKYKAGEIFQ